MESVRRTRGTRVRGQRSVEVPIGSVLEEFQEALSQYYSATRRSSGGSPGPNHRRLRRLPSDSLLHQARLGSMPAASYSPASLARADEAGTPFQATPSDRLLEARTSEPALSTDGSADASSVRNLGRFPPDTSHRHFRRHQSLPAATMESASAGRFNFEAMTSELSSPDYVCCSPWIISPAVKPCSRLSRTSSSSSLEDCSKSSSPAMRTLPRQFRRHLSLPESREPLAAEQAGGGFPDVRREADAGAARDILHEGNMMCQVTPTPTNQACEQQASVLKTEAQGTQAVFRRQRTFPASFPDAQPGHRCKKLEDFRKYHSFSRRLDLRRLALLNNFRCINSASSREAASPDATLGKRS